jgi:hypothetical protein
VRNYELLRRYAAAPERAKKADWIFVFAVVAVLFLIVCIGLIVSLLVVQAIWQFLSAR